jgi:hypothetical protein
MGEKKGMLILFRPISNSIETFILPFSTPKTIIITSILIKLKLEPVLITIILLFI